MRINNGKIKSAIRENKIITIVVILLLIYIVLAIYSAGAIELDKLKFQKARKNIDIVYNDIVKNVGQPDSYKKINECSRPNLEWSQGPLSCLVSTKFVYPANNIDKANEKFMSIKGVVSNHKDIFRSLNPDSSHLLSKRQIGAVIYTSTVNIYDYKKSKNMDCGVKYVFDTPREMDLKVNDSYQALEVFITCSDWAKAQFYPLHQASNLYQ